MCLPRVSLHCMICILETGKSMTCYRYDHGRGPLKYKLRRDRNTRKFPELESTFFCDGGFGKDYYGCIAVPEYEIDIAGAMTYDADHDSLKLNYEFDLNEYDDNDVCR